MMKIKKFWSIEWQIKTHIKLCNIINCKFSFIGKTITMLLDRLLLIIYGIDLVSVTINVKHLSISHPNGILLGGNGIYSKGRVVIMSGVKFGGKSPNNIEYLEKHKLKRVFELGDNVVIGTNSAIIGPITICDNVIIGAMSLVNKSIVEPGVYVGAPVKKISNNVGFEWVSHIIIN